MSPEQLDTQILTAADCWRFRAELALRVAAKVGRDRRPWIDRRIGELATEGRLQDDGVMVRAPQPERAARPRPLPPTPIHPDTLPQKEEKKEAPVPQLPKSIGRTALLFAHYVAAHPEGVSLVGLEIEGVGDVRYAARGAIAAGAVRMDNEVVPYRYYPGPVPTPKAHDEPPIVVPSAPALPASQAEPRSGAGSSGGVTAQPSSGEPASTSSAGGERTTARPNGGSQPETEGGTPSPAPQMRHARPSPSPEPTVAASPDVAPEERGAPREGGGSGLTADEVLARLREREAELEAQIDDVQTAIRLHEEVMGGR